MDQGNLYNVQFLLSLSENFFLYPRQRALFNVLRAFANYDEEVGYCQGMTNIVATILMYCEEEVCLIYLTPYSQYSSLYVYMYE